MRKVINGRTYNTATSKCIGQWSNGHYTNDLKYCSEDLYKNTKGAYFLHGDGGAMSKYAVSSGSNSWGGGSQLIPMTAEDAQAWAEEHLDAEDYEAEFGVQEDAAPSDLTTRERVGMTIDTEIMSRLRAHSASSGVPMSRLLDKAITDLLDSEDK